MTQAELFRRDSEAWSMSFPGVVLPTCGDWDGALEIHNMTGRSLRIGGDIALCFDCGPGGGVYHPDQTDMATVSKSAAELDKGFNKFELHTHYMLKDSETIEHSHRDGDDRHYHPDTGPARFEMTQDEARAYHLMSSGKRLARKVSNAPKGPQMDYVEATEEQSVFHVVINYEFTGTDHVKDKVFRSGPTRAEWRRSMDLYVAAIRSRLLGNPGLDPVGGGAIPMATARMILCYRLTPIYEIRGWNPTPRRALP